MVKEIDLTKEVPELIGLIEICERVDQMEALLSIAIQNKNKIAVTVLDKLAEYEQKNNFWLGENITVSYQNMNFLIQGLNDDEGDPVNVTPSEFLLVIKDKQTKGSEKEKEKS